jgi:hypothetical protein
MVLEMISPIHEALGTVSICCEPPRRWLLYTKTGRDLRGERQVRERPDAVKSGGNDLLEGAAADNWPLGVRSGVKDSEEIFGAWTNIKS